MEAERDYGDGGRIVIKASPAEAALIAEGLRIVWSSDRDIVESGHDEIDECDREMLRAEMTALTEMSFALDEARNDRGLSVVCGGGTIDGGRS